MEDMRRMTESEVHDVSMENRCLFTCTFELHFPNYAEILSRTVKVSLRLDSRIREFPVKTVV